MADQPIHDPKDYSEAVAVIRTDTPVHADSMNPIFERLINNDAFLKAFIDGLAGSGRTTQTVKDNADDIATLIAGLMRVTDGNSGADFVGLTPIADIGAQDSVQEFLEALINKLKATAAGAAGANFIGASAIEGLNGNTVQALMAALKTLLDEHKADYASFKENVVRIKTNITILAANWVDDTATSGFWKYDIPNANITANTVVDVNIRLADLEKADIKSANVSSAGKVTIFADKQPIEDIICDLKLVRQVS